MLQFDEYRVKLNNLKPELDKLGEALDLDSAARELDELHAQSAADGFWDNVEKARKASEIACWLVMISFALGIIPVMLMSSFYGN